MTAIEVVGKGIGGVGQGLAHQQGLIGHLRDALVQHVVVGLILMHIAQTGAQPIDKGIPPLQSLNKGEQEDIIGMTADNMGTFV
jgi:hypothetical protein